MATNNQLKWINSDCQTIADSYDVIEGRPVTYRLDEGSATYGRYWRVYFVRANAPGVEHRNGSTDMQLLEVAASTGPKLREQLQAITNYQRSLEWDRERRSYESSARS